MFSYLKHYKASCLYFVLFLILVIVNSTNASQNTIEKYGRSKGEPIDGGFFFYDNKYIEAPYVIERRGLEIFINGYKTSFVPQPYDWRIFEDPGEPPSDIQIPSGIPWPGTELYDAYWGLKYRYLLTNMDKENANQKFLKIIENLPEISHVEINLNDPEKRIIHYNNGKIQSLNISSKQLLYYPFQPVPSKEELIQRAEESRLYYEQRFKNNNGFFDRSNGGNMTMGASAALRIIDVLIEHESPEGRVEALKNKGSGRLLMDPWKRQLENIKTTPQLAQRAERIKKEIEDERNAKNAISIARGTEDWVSNPVNVLGGNNSYDSEDKYLDSSFNKIEELTQNNDGLFTKGELEDNIQNKQNNSSNILGLISIKPFIVIVAMFIFGAGILIVRRNASSQ